MRAPALFGSPWHAGGLAKPVGFEFEPLLSFGTWEGGNRTYVLDPACSRQLVPAALVTKACMRYSTLNADAVRIRCVFIADEK